MLVSNCDVENSQLAVLIGNGESELEDFGTCVDDITERVNQVTFAFTTFFIFDLNFLPMYPKCSLSRKWWRLNSFTLPKTEQLKQILLRATLAAKRLLFLNQTSQNVTLSGKKKQRGNMFQALNLCVSLLQLFVRQARKDYYFFFLL